MITRWVGIGLAVTSAILVCVVVAVIFVSWDDDIGPKALGESDARDALKDYGIIVPAPYSFGQMIKYPVFSGRESFYGRFDGPATAFTDTTELAAKNPKLSKFRQTDCSDEYIEAVPTKLGISCASGTKVLVSSAESVNSQYFSGPAADSENFVLTTDGTRTSLFVLIVGH